MRRFDKKKIIQAANLRLEHEYIYEKMMINEVGDSVPYNITMDVENQRNVKYKINTREYGVLDFLLMISIQSIKNRNVNYDILNHVDILDRDVDDKDYILYITFKVESSGLNTFPTLGGAQAASIMATNRNAINEFVQEKHDKGYRLIMIYSQPINDSNDTIRKNALDDLKNYIDNRNVTEREVREYARIKKKLDKYYVDTKELILYTPSYEFMDDELEDYGNDTYDFARSFDPNKYFIFLSMYDNEFSLINLTEKVSQELKQKLNRVPSEFELHKGILGKLRDKVKEDLSNNLNYIKGLIRNSKRNERDVDAIEGGMRERLYNNTYDEQINGTDKIAPNPLFKNFVKFKYGRYDSGIYDKLKAEESKEKEKERKAEAERIRIAQEKEDEDARRREEASRNQVLKIKISTDSNLYYKLLNLYKGLMSSQIRDKVKINTPTNDTISITGISQEEAADIIININSSSLGLNLNHGSDGVELTFANQPFEIN